jgi:superfamily II DNA or RNA helicase
MSVLINRKHINKDFINQFSNDLVIQKVHQKDTKFNLLTNDTKTELYYVFIKNGEKFICIPKSYYYHFMNSLPVIKMDYKTINISNFKINLLPRQLEIREETFRILSTSKSILLSLYTGFGKTIFAIYIMYKLKLKTIILCHRAIIIDQWIKSIKKCLPDLDIYKLDSKPNNLEKIKNCDIMIANPINIPKYDFENYTNFGVCIIDEIHTICTESFSKSLFYLFPKYLIGLSATPERMDGMDQIIQHFIGPEVIIRQMSREFNVYNFKTGIKFEYILNNQGSLDWNSILNSQSINEKRNQIIVNLVKYFSTRTILVLVKLKEHANLLKKLFIEQGINKTDIDTFFANKKNCDYNCRILIATYSKGGVGFDHPKLDMLITAGDVEANFQQYLGRIFRRDDTTPIYIDLIDNNNIIKKHSKERTKICEQNGGIIKNFHNSFPSFFDLF